MQADQLMPYFLWLSTLHFSARKRSSLHVISNHMHSFNVLAHYLLKPHFTAFVLSMIISSAFLLQIILFVHLSVIFSKRVTCLAHPVPLDYITLITYGEEHILVIQNIMI
jgi:hypothetical protein